MNEENTSEDEAQEEPSSIPEPQGNAQEEGFDDSDGQPDQDKLILDDLKNRAKQLGIKHHPSIGPDKLREKITEALSTEGAEEPEPIKIDKNVGRAQKKAAALKLIRIRIACMDPLKKNHQGDWFITGNALVGTVKRYVPFDVEWHVPQIMLNMIRDKEFQQLSSTKDERGRDSHSKRIQKTYNVQILDQLTEQELKDLAIKQAMARGEAA